MSGNLFQCEWNCVPSIPNPRYPFDSCLQHDQLRQPNHLDRGQPGHPLCGLNSASVDLTCLGPPCNSDRNYPAWVDGAAAGAASKDARTFSDVGLAWMGLIAVKVLGLRGRCDESPTDLRRGGRPQSFLTANGPARLAGSVAATIGMSALNQGLTLYWTG